MKEIGVVIEKSYNIYEKIELMSETMMGQAGDTCKKCIFSCKNERDRSKNCILLRLKKGEAALIMSWEDEPCRIIAIIICTATIRLTQSIP